MFDRLKFTARRRKQLGVLAIKTYEQSLLDCSICLIYCDKDRLMDIRNSEEVRKFAPFYDYGKGIPAGLCTYYDEYIFIFLEAPVHTNTIAHEALHAVRAIFSRVSTDLCESTNELYAYALGNLTGMINNFLSEYYGHPGYVNGDFRKIKRRKK